MPLAAQLLSRALDAAPWFAQAVAIVAFAYVLCQPVLLAPVLAVGVAVHVISFASICRFLSPQRAQPPKTIPPVPAPAAALASECPDDKPGISIIKPIAGTNDTLRENLESCFRLTYPKLEILFCLHDADDKAVGVIEELIARYPAVDARLLYGEAELQDPSPSPPLALTLAQP
jgi:cellulose synthase/poly-beta-1,6-N-acetylglucosamine synthase-like glycosyltransferase